MATVTVKARLVLISFIECGELLHMRVCLFSTIHHSMPMHLNINTSW